jgi:Immunity protein 26
VKRQRWRSGDLVKIPLSNGTHCYGWVIRAGLIEFLDINTTRNLQIDAIKKSDRLFIISVSRSAITKGHWPIVGLAPRNDARDVFRFFMQDMFTKKLSIYSDDGDDSWKIVPATFEECKDLERFAVWDYGAVEDRLILHFGGAPRFPVDLMRPTPLNR